MTSGDLSDGRTQAATRYHLESYGAEFELNTSPVDGMRLDFSVGLLNATFREFSQQRIVPGAGTTTEVRVKNFNGNPLIAAPPLSFVAVWSYDILLGRLGTLIPRFDATYKDKTYFSPGVNSAQVSIADSLQARTNEGASQEPYWLLNARIAYRTPDDRIEIAAWVRNATDQVYLSNSLDVSNGLNSFLDIYGTPRTFGVTVGYTW